MEKNTSCKRKRRGRRTNLSLGIKKYKRDDPVDPIEEIKIKIEHGTQVTPIKYTSGHIQTDDTSFNSTVSTATAYSEDEEIQCEEISNISTVHSPLPDVFSKLQANGTLEKLSNVLFQHGQINDFSNLLQNIAQGRIDPKNICWVLNLHLARLTSLETTTLMRWDECVIEFFSVIYILFGASAINVLRGPMNFSDLVMENMEKGLFDPLKARINLPVPSVTTLRSLHTGYPTEIPAGLVEHSLDIAEVAAQQGSQYVLSFDGKMVAKGFKGDTYGDIDLWGIEKPISVPAALRLAKQNIATAKKIDAHVPRHKLFEHTQNLLSLLNQVSRRIRTLRGRINGEHYLRLKIVKLAHNQALDRRKQFAYRMQLSYLNEHSARCDSSIGRCLSVNQRIVKALAACRANNDMFSESKLVDLHLQNNAHFLFSSERNELYFDLSIKENSDIVKQRSAKWFAMRKNVKVTGSTLHAALGLESLAEMKQHHYQFIKKRPKPPFPEEINVRLKYGQENEKHALATVIGGLMPAYKPKCFSFQEVGSVFIQVYGDEDFMLVSPDGIVRCLGGDNCPSKKCIEDHSLLPIEAKCVFPDSTKPLQPMYNLPNRYVPQCLSEMAAYGAQNMWFVSYTVTSLSLIRVHFDEELWKLMLTVAYDLHGGAKPKVPVKLHKDTKLLKVKIHEFTQKKCSFLCEIPSFRGVEGLLRESEVLSPHSYCALREEFTVDLRDVERQCKIISIDCIPLFEAIHNTLRQEAQEVLVFMLSDHNRHHEEFLPYSLPLGYAMKGKSLSNQELRHLVNSTRNELKRRGIPVLCEVYDGQWQNLCMQTQQGLPLNELRLIKPTWQRVLRLTKDKCLELLILGAKIKASDLESMAKEQKLTTGERNYYNLHIERDSAGCLLVTSRGGSTFSKPAIQYIRSITEQSRPDLWEESYTDEDMIIDTDRRRSRKVQVGLRDDERSLAHLLDREIANDIECEIGEEFSALEEDPVLTEKDLSQVLLSLTLRHSDVTLLNDIVADLKEFNERKWINLTVEELYPGLLTNSVRLNKECTAPELFVISRTLEQRTLRKFAKSGVPKAMNVNYITQAFGGETFLELPKKKTNRVRQVPSLHSLCKKILQDAEYKLVQLQVSLANALHREKREKWVENCPIFRWGYVPHVFADHVAVPYFSYPEFDEERQQVEFRTLDCTHILTNMKTHILTRGYDFCKKEHFQEVATERPDILSRPLVFDNIDQQNAFSAMQMFSEPVENFIRGKGHSESADFILLARKWFAACDRRGLRADLRVTWLYDMFTFLTKDINFNSFPFPLTGRYWKGVPIQTYEALLQNICTRIQLYTYANNRTYNCRAISTLANESFFSDLGRLDKESRAYPKACNIPKIFGRVVTLNFYKHMPEKNWFLTATHKGTYPEHLAEHDHKELSEQDGFYWNHFFDFPDDHNSQRCRRSDISTGTQPLRFAGGVRKFFRGDESRILPEERAGLEPKGMPIYDEQSGKISYEK